MSDHGLVKTGPVTIVHAIHLAGFKRVAKLNETARVTRFIGTALDELERSGWHGDIAFTWKNARKCLSAKIQDEIQIRFTANSAL